MAAEVQLNLGAIRWMAGLLRGEFYEEEFTSAVAASNGQEGHNMHSQKGNRNQGEFLKDAFWEEELTREVEASNRQKGRTMTTQEM